MMMMVCPLQWVTVAEEQSANVCNNAPETRRMRGDAHLYAEKRYLDYACVLALP